MLLGLAALCLVKHSYISCKTYILICLNRADFLERADEVSWGVHFFHDACHGGCSLVFLLLLLEDFGRNSTFILLLELLVLQKVAGHDPINFFEILQHCQSRVLAFSWHVLT